MKKLALIVLAFAIATFQLDASSIDSTGFPGDHLSLEGVLEIFSKSKSPEDFEKRLNKEDDGINNLDLNNDGDVDYIRVTDHMGGDVHAIVLQVPINENESQDVAVIEIEKTGKESAMLQIVGDAEVYGEETIVEPFQEQVESKGKGGPSLDDNDEITYITVNVWVWRPVRFMYRPAYVAWASPFRWRVYPPWWRVWHPRPWRSYHVHCRPYRAHHRVVTTHRVVHAHRVYTPVRRTSVSVTRKTTGLRTNNHSKVVAGKRTTTVGVKKNGNKVVAGKKTTTVRAKKSGNKVVAGKKTTTAGVKKSGNKVVKGKKTKATGVKKKGNTTTRGKRTTKTVKGKKGKKSGVKRTKTTKVRRKKG